LPDHPLLITFDDGWADHEQVALPLLAQRKLPSLAFIAADAVDSREPTPFWETRLIHAFRRGTLSPDALTAVWRAAGPGTAPSFADLDDVHALIDRLLALPSKDVPGLLASLESGLSTPDRHTLTHAELLTLPARGMAVGGHGASHDSLALLPDAAADLRRAQAELSKRMAAPVRTMAFPHGSYDRRTVAAAHAEGYEFVFTTDRVLNPIPSEGRLPPVLGRIPLDEQRMTDKSGRFRPEVLASWLWRSPIASLDGERPIRAHA
jgi:peptidoglycan/xylan/chitin deacetylase (PgdA/CDA1 family)